jgi:hypothetical protein
LVINRSHIIISFAPILYLILAYFPFEIVIRTRSTKQDFTNRLIRDLFSLDYQFGSQDANQDDKNSSLLNILLHQDDEDRLVR